MLTETTRGARPPIELPGFQLLWAGWTLTALGIQFYAVALVWLVLHLTGSGIELGTVLVVAAVPRAAAMLVSGAVIDRSEPRRVLVAAGATSAVLVGLIALLLSLSWLQFALLLVIAALQGLMDAFFYPGAMAQLTRLVAPAQLTQANALFQTSDSLANIFGPALGGLVVGALGLPLAFLLNSAVFILGGLLLARLQPAQGELRSEPARESLGRSLASGLRHAIHTPAICVSLVMIALLNFAAVGPIVVGGAILVERRFAGGATEFGWMLAAFGLGTLAGGLLAGRLPPLRRPALLLAAAMIAIALGLALIGVAPALWSVIAIMAVIGVTSGVLNVIAVSWLQSRTEPQMQGRMASLLVFSAVAVDPFSNAIAGVLSELDLTLLFTAAGALMGLIGLVALALRAVREAA